MNHVLFILLDSSLILRQTMKRYNGYCNELDYFNYFFNTRDLLYRLGQKCSSMLGARNMTNARAPKPTSVIILLFALWDKQESFIILCHKNSVEFRVTERPIRFFFKEFGILYSKWSNCIKWEYL